MPDAAPAVMDQIVSLCKRRGFIYQASEIYGGLRGFWDYGPLGVLLKNNIRDWWWRCMVECPPIGPGRASRSTSSGWTRPSSSIPKPGRPAGTWPGSMTPWSTTAKPKSRYRADHVKVFVPIDGNGTQLRLRG